MNKAQAINTISDQINRLSKLIVDLNALDEKQLLDVEFTMDEGGYTDEPMVVSEFDYDVDLINDDGHVFLSINMVVTEE